MTTTRLSSTVILKGIETLGSTLANAQQISYSTLNINAQEDDLDKDVVDLSHTLSGTTGSLDLTAAPLARQPAVTVNLTSSYLHAVQIHAPSTNAGNITVKQGASNGFPLLGASSQVVLAPGDTIVLVGAAITDRQAVDGTHKTIDFAGTSDDKVEIIGYFTAVLA